MRQKVTKRRVVGASALLLGLATVFALGAPAAQSASAAAPRTSRALPVLVAPVDFVEGYEAERRYSGELRARRSAALGWEQGGRILRVHVEEGDRVRAGDLLAELESERASAELDGLEAALARQTAQLDELVRGPRPQMIEVARAELRSLEEELGLAEIQRERRAGLVEKDSIAREDLDVANTRVATATARLEAARHRLDVLEEGSRAEDIEEQEAVLTELLARIARVRVDLEDRALRAPFDGVITERWLDEGTVAATGDVALEMIESSALEARVGVPVDCAELLEVGQPATLLIRGERIEAVVRARPPRLDEATRTSDVIVALSAEDSRRFVDGEVVQVLVAEWIPRHGTWLPTEALVPGVRGLWAAFALDPDAGSAGPSRIVRHELEVLHTSGDRVLVDGTLQAGDLVLIDGVHRVVPGQSVLPKLAPSS